MREPSVLFWLSKRTVVRFFNCIFNKVFSKSVPIVLSGDLPNHVVVLLFQSPVDPISGVTVGLIQRRSEGNRPKCAALITFCGIPISEFGRPNLRGNGRTISEEVRGKWPSW